MYVNLIWAWGHPEVYILVLPAFGIYSEVFPTFSRKRLFGYRSMAAATMGICVISFMVWLHHFFTMGAGADVNAFFGIATSIIAIPTGVKIFNWLFTMYGGELRFEVPLMWSIGFILLFVIGGASGVLLAIPPADFQLHNSQFLIAHFHNVIIPGVLFGAFAGYNYWFPKAFGFRLHRGLGMASFWCWSIGFVLAFMPLYVLGLAGATRRMQHYPETQWQPLMIVAFVGALVILAGIVLILLQLFVSIRQRERLRDATGDPWDGRTLEWATPSPPPPWNFAVLPQVAGIDALWEAKRGDGGALKAAPGEGGKPLHMPRPTPLGVVIAFLAFFGGFGAVWHIAWLACGALAGIVIACLVRAWNTDREVEIDPGQVAAFERGAQA